MIKLYVLDDISENRGQLFPLLKPFLKKANFSDVQRRLMYGVSENDFSIVDDITQSQYAILPNSWNYYQENRKMQDIVNRIKNCSKPVLSFCEGDYGVAIPELSNCTVFRPNGNRSKLNEKHIGIPIFIKDPLPLHFNLEEINLRSFNEKPVIGFCGQANASSFNGLKEIFRTLVRNLKYYLGLRHELPQPLLSTSKLRAIILRSIEKSNRVVSNFILRKKYRAGATNPTQKAKTTQEFYDNMNESDYMVCVRGGGNFSVRFYEALAMGRIPVFINTDCLLSLVDQIDWKQHVVWVEYHERHKVVQKVLDFHQDHTAESFKNLQLANRKLWLESLTLGGFFKSTLV